MAHAPNMPAGLSVADVQSLLAQAGLYHGAIDGDAGPRTWAAVAAAEQSSKQAGWPDTRRLVAAAQAVLAAQGFEPGDVDGYCGHNTREALTAWRSREVGADATVHRVPKAVTTNHPAQLAYPRQRDLEEFYGMAGGLACTRGVVELPFPFRVAWNTAQRISRFACHEKLAKPFSAWLSAAAKEYGETRFRDLGLDLYGGCFHYRKMRGGQTLSLHAYGAAIDLDPLRNQLRWKADRAEFAKPEYQRFLETGMEHGVTPAGYAWGADWMHFQFARF